MNILFIAGKDSWNYSLPNIIHEFIKKNHNIELYCIYEEYHNVKMFIEHNIKFGKVNELTLEKINSFDIIFLSEGINYTQPISKMLIGCRKYIFSVANLFQNAYISTIADFIFTMGENNRKFLNQLKYFQSKISIGNAQYDTLKNSDDKHYKRILFIDRGYYPFGSAGKNELVSFLIQICQSFKDYELVIKPRYLIGENENVTHYSNEHLYSYIMDKTKGNLPDNLVLLEEHRNLEELINESDCIITAFSSAYIEAAVSDKGIIIIDGLPSDEVIEFRNDILNEIKERMMLSGCVVNYKDAINYLPDGIKIKKDYFHNEIYDINETAKKIVQAVEYMFTTFLSQERVPEVCDYDFENFQQSIISSGYISWDELIKNRIINNFLLKKESHRIKLPGICWSRVEKEIIDLCKLDYLVNPGNMNELGSLVDKIINQNIVSNKVILMKNKIDQSILFNTYFINKQYDEISSINEEEVLSKEAYYFYFGKICFINNEYRKAIDYLKAYYAIEEKKNYVETFVDYKPFKISAIFYIGQSYQALGDTENALKYYKLCKRESNNKHKMAEKLIENLISAKGDEK